MNNDLYKLLSIIYSYYDSFHNFRYDFKVDEVKKLRVNYEFVGTLYLGPDSVPQNDTKVKVHDKIFAIEEPVPVADRNEKYEKITSEAPEKSEIHITLKLLNDAFALVAVWQPLNILIYMLQLLYCLVVCYEEYYYIIILEISCFFCITPNNVTLITYLKLFFMYIFQILF